MFVAIFVLLYCAPYLGAEQHIYKAEASYWDGQRKGDANIVYSRPFITAKDSQFGDKIEGTSVDSLGRMYAVDFGDETSQLGQFSNGKGDIEQRLFLNWTDSSSYFNGIRFLPVPREQSEDVASKAVVADKKGQLIEVFESKDGQVTARVYCKDEEMIQPNDVAVAYKSGRVYSSGLDYAPTTELGDGDIWLCTVPSSSRIESYATGTGPVANATRLRVQGRANGIEISNDENYFYAAETWANDTKIYSNVVWKYEIDREAGHLSNKKLFFDMKQIDEELEGIDGDIDGVRIDTAGNLFLVRNGVPGEVVKVSPAGVAVLRIKLQGITEPTNIELGGPYGKTLFIVGKCKETNPSGVQVGCIDIWEGNEAPGRAYSSLVRPRLEHDGEL